MASNVALPETIRTKAFGVITTAFTVVGTPFLHTLRIFRIINATDGDLFFSIDGVNNQFFLPAGTFVLYDITSNSGISSNFIVPYGTQFYVKYSTIPGEKAVYIEGIYGKGE